MNFLETRLAKKIGQIDEYRDTDYKRPLPQILGLPYGTRKEDKKNDNNQDFFNDHPIDQDITIANESKDVGANVFQTNTFGTRKQLTTLDDEEWTNKQDDGTNIIDILDTEIFNWAKDKDFTNITDVESFIQQAPQKVKDITEEYTEQYKNLSLGILPKDSQIKDLYSRDEYFEAVIHLKTLKGKKDEQLRARVEYYENNPIVLDYGPGALNCYDDRTAFTNTEEAKKFHLIQLLGAKQLQNEGRNISILLETAESVHDVAGFVLACKELDLPNPTVSLRLHRTKDRLLEKSLTKSIVKKLLPKSVFQKIIPQENFEHDYLVGKQAKKTFTAFTKELDAEIDDSDYKCLLGINCSDEEGALSVFTENADNSGLLARINAVYCNATNECDVDQHSDHVCHTKDSQSSAEISAFLSNCIIAAREDVADIVRVLKEDCNTEEESFTDESNIKWVQKEENGGDINSPLIGICCGGTPENTKNIKDSLTDQQFSFVHKLKQESATEIIDA